MKLLQEIFTLVTPTIAILCLTLYSFANRIRAQHSLGENADGQPTEESVVKYRKTLKLQIFSTQVTVFTGFLISVASAFQVIITGHEDQLVLFSVWLRVSSWCLILAQSISLIGPAVNVSRLGIFLTISVTLLLWNVGQEMGRLLLLSERSASSEISVLQWLSVYFQLTLGTLAIISSASFQRRPRVFHKGHPVDAQNTVSYLNSYTLHWAGPLLERAKLSPQIGFSDLAALEFVARAKNLQSQFLNAQIFGSSRLWSDLYRSHKIAFWRQWILAVFQSVIAFLPSLCLFQTLHLLEKKQAGGSNSHDTWLWALGIGISRMAQQWLEARLNWLSSSSLEIPIRAQLSSVVYEKTLHLSDIKASTSTLSSADEKDAEQIDTESDTDDVSNLDDSKEPLDSIPLVSLDLPTETPVDNSDIRTASHQGSINLVAVDSARIAEFAARSYILVGIVVTLIVAATSLVKLIGWISFGTALLAPLLFTPLNMLASRKYATAQGKLMRVRDDKLVVVDEALRGIRHIKFAASESYWETQIMKLRASELWQQRMVFKWIVVMRLFWISSPILLSVISLGTYSFVNGSLSPSVAFTALTIFANMELALSVIPFAYTQGADAHVSSRRVDTLLNMKEKKEKRCPGSSVAFEHAAISWPQPPATVVIKPFTLSNVNINFKSKKINLICGASGTGKSLILSAIIGEAELKSGTIFIPVASDTESGKPWQRNLLNTWLEEETIAFVAQVPWIENCSIKDNILSGLPYVETRYKDTLVAAALLPDLDVLEDGDLTEVGSQGINLSGGQRWRVTFARALYSRAGILILDDILSAVDAHVGRHIFFNGLLGPLGQGRTRILATHHTLLCLPEADYAIHISRRGHVRELPLSAKKSKHLLQPELSSDKRQPEFSECDFQRNTVHPMAKSVGHENTDEKATTPRTLVQKEFRQQGKIPWSLYQKYINASGGLKYWVLAVAVILTSQVALLGRTWWVKVWSQTSITEHHEDTHSAKETDLSFFLGVYIIISSIAAFMEAVKCGFVYLAALQTSHQLFKRLSYLVLRSKLRWLDTTPVGRILNRFTADFALLDSRIPGETHTLLSALFSLMIIFLVGATVSFYVILVELSLLAVCFLLVSRFLRGAEEIKRLEGTAKTPIFEHYDATLLGLSTIRSMMKTDRYRARMLEHIDTQSQCTWASALTTQWMALRISAIGAVFTASVAVVVAVNNTSAAAAGFILNFSLDYSKSMDEAVKRFSNLQLNMNSTERIVDYLEIPTENQGGEPVPRDWPSQGSISFRNLSVKFAPDLPDVLKKVNAEILPGQRIGIVGRTGAGKSTLALALFRFLEVHSGSIEIDGINISKIRLHDLRTKMSIVAQDPVLFSGSIRSNLDPMCHYSNFKLLESLRKVHLINSSNRTEQEQPLQDASDIANLNVFENLDSPVSEGGLNLSHGQRQLLSLARAILNQSKIMVMDEATSSIDTATDSLIQRAIREEFAKSTLLVIAHRLSTVADFDKILVMDNGLSIEFGNPVELMEQKGEFWNLVCESGERQKIEEMIYSSRLVHT